MKTWHITSAAFRAVTGRERLSHKIPDEPGAEMFDLAAIETDRARKQFSEPRA